MKGDIEFRDGGTLTIHLAEDGSEPDKNGILTMVTVRAFDEIRRQRKRPTTGGVPMKLRPDFDYISGVYPQKVIQELIEYTLDLERDHNDLLRAVQSDPTYDPTDPARAAIVEFLRRCPL